MRADLALREVGELLDLLTDGKASARPARASPPSRPSPKPRPAPARLRTGLWFAVTVSLLLAIRTLRPRELGEATRLEMQQHNSLVRTARVLLAANALAFCAQCVAFTPAGKGDGETIAEILQIGWFIVQLCACGRAGRCEGAPPLTRTHACRPLLMSPLQTVAQGSRCA